MSGLWPWLAVAGAGALHGLNPATGWMFAAAWGVGSRDRTQALRALVPIGLGHAASVGLVAGVVLLGVSMDRVMLQVVAGALLAAVVALHVFRRRTAPGRSPCPAAQVAQPDRAGHAGLALWSFMMSTAHGAGLMLVPALVPLCMGEASAARDITASGTLLLAMAAVGVHSAAMLAVTGLVAAIVCRSVDAGAGWLCGMRGMRRD